MKYKWSALLLFTFLLVFFNLAFAQRHGIEESPLDHPYNLMIEAYENLDAEILRKVYHESALYLSPNRNKKIQKGISSFIPGFEGMFTNAKVNNEELILTFKIEKRDQRDGIAVDVGYYKLVVKSQVGEERTSYGKFVTMLTKDPDTSTWKFAIDGYSPAPPIEF